MRPLTTIMAFLLLSGCTHVRSFNEQVATCEAKLPLSHYEYGECMDAEEIAAKQADYDNHLGWRILHASLQGGMNAVHSAPPRQQPVNCTTIFVAGTAQTQCY